MSRSSPAVREWNSESGGASPEAQSTRPALKIALMYGAFAGLWIYFSDRALAVLFSEEESLVLWSSFKGLFFVSFTSLLLFLLIKRSLRQAESAHRIAQVSGLAALSEKSFSDAMIESMPGILYFYDAEGRFLRWNRNFETVSGFCAEELKGMHPLDFFAEEHKMMLAGRIREVFQLGESSVEAPFLTKSGRMIPYFFTGRKVRFEGKDCLVGMGIDVSQRKEAEEALRQSEHRYRTTLDNILEGCQLLGFDWKYLYLNNAAARHNRRPNEVLLGRTMQDCWPGIERSRIYKLLEGCLNRRTPVQAEVEFPFPDGSTGWFDVRAQPVPEGIFVLSIDITDRHLAEMALRESESKYRELVQNANSIILRWTADGTIRFLNEYGQRLFGRDAGEVLGMIIPADEDRPASLKHLLRRVLEESEGFEETVKLKEGQGWIAWTHRVVQTGEGQITEVLSVGTDVTERKKASEALRRNEEQFRLIMNNLADLVAVLDLEGRRIYNSPSYGGILGDVEGLKGSISFDQVHPDDRGRVQASFRETIQTGRGRRLEYRLMDRQGNPRFIESQGSVIRDAQGQVAQVVVVSRDITERRGAELAIRELNATLEKRVEERTAELAVARDRAEAADRLKSAFLATMSHELRTPLNSIIGFTGIILQGLAGPLNPEQQKQLGMVRSSARHLLELINDVLDISKIEAGEMEVRAASFDLQGSLERVVKTVQPMADRKKLELRLEVPEKVPQMESDQRRVEQILLNLLNNAIKFTEVGKVILMAKVLPASAEGGCGTKVRMSVRDTGPGIAPSDLPLLFQPFRQIDSGLARKHEGTGLGLAICRRLASLLGGEAGAQSELGSGSVFYVTLPLIHTHECDDSSD